RRWTAPRAGCGSREPDGGGGPSPSAILGDVSERRTELRDHLPHIVRTLDHGAGAHLTEIYSYVERNHAHLVDDERDPPPGNGLKWKHDLRWEVETLVLQGVIMRRKDLGRARYSPGW